VPKFVSRDEESSPGKGVLPQRLREILPRVQRKTQIEKELRFRSTYRMRTAEQVVLDLAFFDFTLFGVGQLQGAPIG
jgi:hypothetical protein